MFFIVCKSIIISSSAAEYVIRFQVPRTIVLGRQRCNFDIYLIRRFMEGKRLLRQHKICMGPITKRTIRNWFGKLNNGILELEGVPGKSRPFEADETLLKGSGR